MTSPRWVVGNRWDELDGVHPEELPLVSVIVAHYEQPAELARTLRALAAQDYPADRLEIIVADDGSRSEVTVPDGVILARQEDRGFRLSAVRNLGVRASRGEVLCFLDADTAPEPQYVRAMTRLPALAPEALTVGRRRHADFTGVGLDVPIVEATQGRTLPEPSWLAEEYARSRNLLHADDRSYRFIIGAVMACSRQLFDEVGGFDESFTTYGGEDWEWAHRMWQAGAILAHEPNAVAWHDGPEWAGRDGSGLERANAQTMRLLSAVPVPGSGPRGLLSATPDLIIRLRGVHSAEALFIGVDSMLLAFPLARVVLDPESPRVVEDPRVSYEEEPLAARVIWDVPYPVVIQDAEVVLRERIAALGTGDVGSIELYSENGEALGLLHSERARRRAERWGTPNAFKTDRLTAPGIWRLHPTPRVDAWVGGWGGAAELAFRG